MEAAHAGLAQDCETGKLPPLELSLAALQAIVVASDEWVSRRRLPDGPPPGRSMPPGRPALRLVHGAAVALRRAA
jgi:hypothetical protein